MTHELKTWPESFQPIWDGRKLADIRIDDRGYREGDVLVLQEWLPKVCEHTGRQVEAVVTHVLPGPRFGVPERYAMLSIRVRSRSGESAVSGR